MPAILRASVLAAAAVLATAGPLPADPDEATSVYVRIPYGVSAGVTTVTQGPGGMKYVSVENLTIPNPSRQSPQTADPRDFHLVAGSHSYLPAARKGLGALDFSEAELVPAGGALHATVTFLVPPDVTRADFEFTPHWFADDGRTVDFCCDYP